MKIVQDYELYKCISPRRTLRYIIYSLSSTNLNQYLDLIILVIDQTLEALLLHLCQFDPLRDHLMWLHTPLAQRINHLLEVSHLIRRNTQIRPLLEIEVIRINRAGLLPNGNVDNTTPRSRRMNSLRQRRLHTCAIIYNMHALVLGELSAPLRHIFFGRINDIVGAELLCKFLPPPANFRDNNFIAAFCFEGEDGGNANWTAAEDERYIAFLERTDFHGVPAYGERFNEGADFEGHVVGKVVESRGGDDDVVCKAAAPA